MPAYRFSSRIVAHTLLGVKHHQVPKKEKEKKEASPGTLSDECGVFDGNYGHYLRMMITLMISMMIMSNELYPFWNLRASVLMMMMMMMIFMMMLMIMILMMSYILGPNIRQRTTVALTVTHIQRLDNWTCSSR